MTSSRPSRPIVCLAVLLGGVLVAGCEAKGAPESERSVTRVEGPRQTDDLGHRLPFVTHSRNRWNSANDGTAYEPCTAISDVGLSRLGVDPSTVRDAAGTDGQTLRGCAWRYSRIAGDPWGWSASQFVGNAESLASNKERYSSTADVWLPDEVLGGRQVGVHLTRNMSDCDTYVQSGRAGVYTQVVYIGKAPPPPSEICDRALAFTAATISKMPI